jgi:tetratricopeptide (TPR) repeat protein
LSKIAGRFALIVAADQYEDDKFSQLRAPAHDAATLEGVLADPAIGGFDVRPVINQSAQTVRDEVERFFRHRAPDDLLLLYFACHGVRDRRGRLYLAMTDTRLDLLASRGIQAEFVNEQVESSPSRKIVLLLDCCYSGAFAKGFNTRSNPRADVAQELSGEGRVVITASDALEYAFEDDQLSNSSPRPSVFTGAVIRGLQTGEADLDKDGQVSVDEFYQFVHDDVRRRMPSQTPIKAGRVSGSIYLAANPQMGDAPVSPGGDPFAAMTSEQTWKREEATLTLRRMAEGSDEAMARQAQAALERLTGDHERLVRASAAAALGDVTRASYERGVVLADLGDYVGADAEFEKVIDASPPAPELSALAHFNRAAIAERAGDGSAAAVEYEHALASDTPLARSRAALNLGRLHHAANRLKEAAAMYDLALSFGDRDVDPRAAFLRGVLHEDSGELGEAWLCYAKSADADGHPFAVEARKRYRALLAVASEQQVLTRVMRQARMPDPETAALWWLAKYFRDNRSVAIYERMMESADPAIASQARESLEQLRQKQKEDNRTRRQARLSVLLPKRLR